MATAKANGSRRGEALLWTIINGADIYTPRPAGTGTITIAAGKILQIGEALKPLPGSVGFAHEEIDATACYAVPGFIDPHVHLTGAGGEQGFQSRTPEVPVSGLVGAGVTTAVGCLGTDSITRTLEGLLGRVRALRLAGISAFMYTGAFQVPPPNMTGSTMRDVLLIPEVLGTGEIAIADVRGSQPSLGEIARLVADTAVGGNLSGKAGITHFHVGPGRTHLAILHRLLDEHEIEADRLVVTHIERTRELMLDAVKLTNRGAFADMDCVEPGVAEWVKHWLDAGGAPDRLSLSSDGHAGAPVTHLYNEFVSCLREQKLPLERVLPFFSTNAARALRLGCKGKLEPGFDGDVLVIEKESFRLRHVISRGKVLMRDGEVVACLPHDELSKY